MAWVKIKDGDDGPIMREIADEILELPRPPKRWITCCNGMVQRESIEWMAWYRHRGRDPYECRRPKIGNPLRRAVIGRDGYICQICGAGVAPSDVHLDHIIPFAHGGPTTIDNLRVAHSRCNIKRGVGI
jgi:5-methylcytosine-specific restriction endonuclease McrA